MPHCNLFSVQPSKTGSTQFHIRLLKSMFPISMSQRSSSITGMFATSPLSRCNASAIPYASYNMSLTSTVPRPPVLLLNLLCRYCRSPMNGPGERLVLVSYVPLCSVTVTSKVSTSVIGKHSSTATNFKRK